MYIDLPGRKLKLDLHTHCKEATEFRPPDEGIAAAIAAQIRRRGLDGIAVTEHNETEYGFRLRDVMARYHPDIVIIPGAERRRGFDHVVELHFDDDVVFRFIAHPGNLWGARDLSPEDGIHGVEIANGREFVYEDRVREYASANGLILLANSDAHHIPDIGCYHNFVDLGEMYAKAKGNGQNGHKKE